MGRKTWESIPESKRPLKNRINVVLTTGDSIKPQENLMVFSDFDTALTHLAQDLKVNEIFVIGGSSLYEASMTTHKDHCKLVVATRINKKFECDTFIKDLESSEHFSPLFVSQTYS